MVWRYGLQRRRWSGSKPAENYARAENSNPPSKIVGAFPTASCMPAHPEHKSGIDQQAPTRNGALMWVQVLAPFQRCLEHAKQEGPTCGGLAIARPLNRQKFEADRSSRKNEVATPHCTANVTVSLWFPSNLYHTHAYL